MGVPTFFILYHILGVLALNSNGMTVKETGSDGVGELFKVNGEGCGIMVFQFDGSRYGVFGFNNNKITPISPSIYVSCNTTDQTYNLYVDQNTSIIYFKAAANRVYGYKIINSIGII